MCSIRCGLLPTANASYNTLVMVLLGLSAASVARNVTLHNVGKEHLLGGQRRFEAECMIMTGIGRLEKECYLHSWVWVNMCLELCHFIEHHNL